MTFQLCTGWLLFKFMQIYIGLVKSIGKTGSQHPDLHGRDPHPLPYQARVRYAVREIRAQNGRANNPTQKENLYMCIIYEQVFRMYPLAGLVAH